VSGCRAELRTLLDPRVRWLPREWDFVPMREPRPGPGVVREP
jgi:hypothetical protein